jgi:threonine/homoserine/homoserine lactone efflux protein
VSGGVDPSLYLRGLAIGFAVAFALGPVGLLVIRRTIEHGWAHGFVSGLGVASADGTYAAIAAFGLTAVTSVLLGIERGLGIAGGILLIVMAARGLVALRAAGSVEAAADPEATTRRPSAVTAYSTIYGLTLTNPATIISFAALFAGLGAGSAGVAGSLLITGGVVTGSALWWLLLTSLVAGLRARMTPSVVRTLNLVASCVIGAFGLGAVAVGVVAGA